MTDLKEAHFKMIHKYCDYHLKTILTKEELNHLDCENRDYKFFTLDRIEEIMELALEDNTHTTKIELVETEVSNKWRDSVSIEMPARELLIALMTHFGVEVNFDPSDDLGLDGYTGMENMGDKLDLYLLGSFLVDKSGVKKKHYKSYSFCPPNGGGGFACCSQVEELMNKRYRIVSTGAMCRYSEGKTFDTLKAAFNFDIEENAEHLRDRYKKRETKDWVVKLRGGRTWHAE